MTMVGALSSQIIRQKSSTEFTIGPKNNNVSSYLKTITCIAH